MTEEQFRDRRWGLLNYLQDKVDEKDWHAVSDAANDLRVLEARQNGIQSWKRIPDKNQEGQAKRDARIEDWAIGQQSKTAGDAFIETGHDPRC